MAVRMWARVLALVLATGLATGCIGHGAARNVEPTRWQVHAGSVLAEASVHVFGPDHEQATGSKCVDSVVAVKAAPRDALVVEEDTCTLGGGASEPGRSHEHSPRPPTVLDVLNADGAVRQLPGAPGNGMTHLLAVSPDGTVLASAGDNQVFAYTVNTGWRAVTAGHHGLDVISHTGDGGPAQRATMALTVPAPAAVAPDGSGYIAEPFAVRRITPRGTITTVAGTNRFDSTSTSGFNLWWGGRENSADVGNPARPTSPFGPATQTGMPYIVGLAVGDDRTIWITSRNTVYRIANGRFTAFAALPPGGSRPTRMGPVTYLHDRSLAICVGHRGAGYSSVYRLSLTTHKFSRLAALPHSCTDITQSTSGAIFVAAATHGLYRVET